LHPNSLILFTIYTNITILFVDVIATFVVRVARASGTIGAGVLGIASITTLII